MSRHELGADGFPHPDPPHDLGTEVVDGRAVARLYRRIGGLAVALLLLLVATVWGGDHGPVPGSAAAVAGLGLGCWLLVSVASASRLVVAQSRRLSAVARQLEVANRRLATSNEELGAFAGRIAHDLRSPLGTVVTALQTLDRRDLPLTPETRDVLLAQALRASRRSVDAVGALLDHATAEGRGPDGSLVDVGEVAGEVLATLPTTTVGTTEVLLPAAPAVAWADHQLLRLVLQNLVTNALAHGGDGLARVQVTVRDDGGAVEVSVEDDGVGIPADQRGEVFVPGARASTTQGLGLGLATCASIVARHGGRIWADESALGGAAVRFTLPWPPGQRTLATSSSSGSSSRTASAP